VGCESAKEGLRWWGWDMVSSRSGGDRMLVFWDGRYMACSSGQVRGSR
jgi:hypothetical protein